MKLQDLIPMLETANLRESIEFYEQKIGFTVQGVYPDEKEPCWASLRKDDVVLMLSGRNEHSKHKDTVFTGSLYFYPDDVDEMWESLKDSAEVCYEIENFDYGMREFGIYDPNRYLLQFGQDVGEIDDE
ncbi:MAG: VOC family protein [Pyrinomonadaceae bacterium]